MKIKQYAYQIFTLPNVDMCGVEGKRRTSDLNVTGSRPPLAIRHIRWVLLVNSSSKLKLLSWLLTNISLALGDSFLKSIGVPDLEVDKLTENHMTMEAIVLTSHEKQHQPQTILILSCGNISKISWATADKEAKIEKKLLRIRWKYRDVGVNKQRRKGGGGGTFDMEIHANASVNDVIRQAKEKFALGLAMTATSAYRTLVDSMNGEILNMSTLYLRLPKGKVYLTNKLELSGEAMTIPNYQVCKSCNSANVSIKYVWSGHCIWKAWIRWWFLGGYTLPLVMSVPCLQGYESV